MLYAYLRMVPWFAYGNNIQVGVRRLILVSRDLMVGDYQLVWLASLPERSMQSGRRYGWSDTFSNSVLAAEFTECHAGNGPMEHPSDVLWGIAGVRVDRRHSPLDVLTKYEACQVRGWQMLVETTGSYDLAQELVFFRVETVWLLDQPIKVSTYNGVRN